MTTVPSPDPPAVVSGREADDRMWRFDRAERALHWVNAAIFGVLMATAAVLYAGPLSTLVGRRELIRQVHVWSGLALPVVFALAWVGPWRRGLRDDLGRLNRWDSHDRGWLRSLGRDPWAKAGKFNAGQKINAAVLGAGAVVLLGTGSIMRWFSPFPVDWRTGATFVHDWTALVVTLFVIGHVAKAFGDPVALRSMVRGWVPADWARRVRPRWYDEQRG